MYPLSALLGLALSSNFFPCSQLDGKLFSEVSLPSQDQSFQAVAASKNLVVLAAFKPEQLQLTYVRGEEIFQNRVPTPQGLDLRLARLAVGEDETTVVHDRKLAAIISGGKITNTVTFPNVKIRRAYILENEILWSVEPLVPPQITAPPDERRLFPAATLSSSSYPVVMRTNLLGLNPEPVVELPFESSDAEIDDEPLRRTLHDVIVTPGGGEFAVFDYTGAVLWKKGSQTKQWPEVKGLRFIYELPEVRAQIEKAKEDHKRQIQQKSAMERLDATKRPVPTPPAQPGRFLPAPVFGARGVHRDLLLVALNLVATPARAVLLYQPSRAEPQCFQIPAKLWGKNVGLLTENDAAVNDKGLWLLKPFGFFPWEAFLSPHATEEGQQSQDSLQ